MKDKKEQSLLGEMDGMRLGIVSIDLKGTTEEVLVEKKRITMWKKSTESHQSSNQR